MTTTPVQPSPTVVTRRALLVGGATLTAAGAASAAVAPALAANQGPLGAVFTLGVASGDPLPTGVVLWTRLARDPLA
jgi:alkaline phosphatase D